MGYNNRLLSGLLLITSAERKHSTGQGEQHDQHLSSGQEGIGN